MENDQVKGFSYIMHDTSLLPDDRRLKGEDFVKWYYGETMQTVKEIKEKNKYLMARVSK